MDGSGVVALLILLAFIFNYQPNKNQPVQQSQSDYAYYQADQSDWHYQYLAEDRIQAIIKKYNPNIAQADADRIKIATNLNCKEKDLDPRLILAIMARESRYNSQAVSPSGAKGLGQIMPQNFQSLGITDPYNIEQNIKGLTVYLRQKIDEWQGQKDQLGLALASYLEGSGAIRKNGNTYSGHTQTYVSDILKIRSMI